MYKKSSQIHKNLSTQWGSRTFRRRQFGDDFFSTLNLTPALTLTLILNLTLNLTLTLTLTPPKHKRIADELPSPKRPIAETSHSVIQHYATNVVPSIRPKDNTSYDTLVKYQSHITMKVKLQVFEDMAHKTNMFFSAFQMDGPMVPFQYSVV